MGSRTQFYVDKTYKPKSDADDSCIIAVKYDSNADPAPTAQGARDVDRQQLIEAIKQQGQGCSQNPDDWRPTAAFND